MGKTLIVIIGWLIMSMLAYPRNKKWCIENDACNCDGWSISDMGLSIFASITMWYIILTWYVFEKIQYLDFWDKPSKL